MFSRDFPEFPNTLKNDACHPLLLAVTVLLSLVPWAAAKVLVLWAPEVLGGVETLPQQPLIACCIARLTKTRTSFLLYSPARTDNGL